MEDSLCLIFTRRLLSRDCDRRRNWLRTERRQKVSDAKSKKSVRSALQHTVGRVSRSRDLFLFGLTDYYFPIPFRDDEKSINRSFGFYPRPRPCQVVSEVFASLSFEARTPLFLFYVYKPFWTHPRTSVRDGSSSSVRRPTHSAP